MITARVTTPDDQIITRINTTLQEAKEYYIAHLGTVTVEEIKEEKEIATMTTTIENKKVLYFEGAGWADADSSKASNLGNCRIRTAFTNNDGKQVYLEMGNTYRYNDKMKPITNQALRIDFVHYITDGGNDCNESRIPYNHEELKNLDYTKEAVLNWINKNLNCSFEEVEVLNDLTGYRVHADNRGHNFGDTFINDPMLTAKRLEIKKHYHDLEVSEGKQYPNFSLWVDETDANKLHLLRHWNNLNRHWTITINGKEWTAEETKLGRYAC